MAHCFLRTVSNVLLLRFLPHVYATCVFTGRSTFSIFQSPVENHGTNWRTRGTQARNVSTFEWRTKGHGMRRDRLLHAARCDVGPANNDRVESSRVGSTGVAATPGRPTSCAMHARTSSTLLATLTLPLLLLLLFPSSSSSTRRDPGRSRGVVAGASQPLNHSS